MTLRGSFQVPASQVSMSHSMEIDVRPYLAHKELPMTGEKISLFAVGHKKGVDLQTLRNGRMLMRVKD
jgi:hypothetical protein